MRNRCDNCHYFEPSSEHKARDFDGECRRKSPGNISISVERPGRLAGVSLISFPLVAKDDWCGEFDQARAVE